MALRAFQANPSLGGFGGESLFSRREGPLATSQSRIGGGLTAAAGDSRPPADADEGRGGGASFDAFAQIVKELVDNAVDACAHADSSGVGREGRDDDDGCENRTMRRVRVDITPEAAPRRPEANDNESTGSCEGNAATMDCLRVVISDNGCGMENIDDCVNAFRSNKNGATNQSKDSAQGGLAESSQSTKKKGGKKNKASPTQPSSEGNENYTSGRYGVGLTLSLLHAQRLVPGVIATITTATLSAGEWTRAWFEADADADDIVCKKRELIAKEVEGESGTTISLYLPGGEEAKRAWPRLAEYFARFQLSIDLPCSLEVKAPSLQSRPVYVRPPAEIERRMIRRKERALAAQRLNENDADSDSDGGSDNWEGDDGFSDGQSADAEAENPQQRLSNAARKRAEAEVEKKKKLSLIHKAASAYKSRPDLKLENVAHASQPIRRGAGSSGASSSKDGPVLEVALVVFGPEPDEDNGGDGDGEHGDDPQQDNTVRNGGKGSSRLQVVRMVNGIALLDSPEAVACGVVKKISNNAATWNSFGLQVLHSQDADLDLVPSSERDAVTFAIDDSAQVAPFLRSGTHSMYEDRSISSDDDDFDLENIGRGKRRKEQGARCILPAPLRLGDVLMVVQIRAKPSALPLPTLSKGRLPLNDRGVSDALENGLSECLRSLQRSSPGLLLTAHQLKRVERDVKYAPAVASAIALVLGKSRRSGVADNAMDTASGWDDEAKRMGTSCSANETERGQRRGGRSRSNAAERSSDLMSPTANDERVRVETLSSLLERRLRFVVSDEFKAAKKAEEREKQRREREEDARKRAKKSRAAESDGMRGDCFDSDDGRVCLGKETESPRVLSRKPSNDDFRSDFDDSDSDANSPVRRRRPRFKRGSVGRSEHSSTGGLGQRRKNPSRYDSESDASNPLARNRTRRSSVESIASSDRSSDCGSRRRRGRLGSPAVYNSQNGDSLGSGRSSLARHHSPLHQKGDGHHSTGHSRGYQRGIGRPKSPRDIDGSSLVHDERAREQRAADDGWDDGYESSPMRRQRRRSPLHPPARQDRDAEGHDDGMSSGSEWSSQFGEVVAGHFFR